MAGVFAGQVGVQQVAARADRLGAAGRAAGLSTGNTIHRNLAGTTPVAPTERSNRRLGRQALFGIDEARTASLSLGMKGRWAKVDVCRDGSVWDRLRSHGPNRRRGGAESVSGWMKINATDLFGVGVNVKHRFQTGAAPRKAQATPVFLCRDAIRRGTGSAADLRNLRVFTGRSEAGAA